MQEIEGTLTAPRGHVVLVAARFNDMIVEQLIRGARDQLIRHGLSEDHLTCVRVPGAFELPLVCQQLAESGRYKGIVALGAVIRGQTPHFDFVASSCASGIMQASLKTNVPMVFGVLTTDTIEQAVERSGTKSGNKGADVALSLIEMMNVVALIND